MTSAEQSLARKDGVVVPRPDPTQVAADADGLDGYNSRSAIFAGLESGACGGAIAFKEDYETEQSKGVACDTIIVATCR